MKTVKTKVKKNGKPDYADATTAPVITPPDQQAIAAATQLRDKVIAMLPDGKLKNFVEQFKSNPSLIGIAKAWMSVFKGRAYRDGEYWIGEKFMYHVLGYDIHSRHDVPDEIVPVAQLWYTCMFGIRINDLEDMECLIRNNGDYIKRMKNNCGEEFPKAVVDRAYLLYSTYFAEATWKWEPSYALAIPLVGQIPHPTACKTWYTGPLPYGGEAVNGWVKKDSDAQVAQIDTVTNATGVKENNPTKTQTQDAVASLKNSKLLIPIIIIAILAVFFIVRMKRK